MKPVGVNSSTYFDFDKENNNEDSKLEVGNHVKVTKYKNIFAKGYTPNCPVEVFVINKVKNTVPGKYVLEDLMVKKLLGRFIKKNCKRQSKKKV